jgi:predicted DNA-binding protein YlxM (UPF0122 family)
MTQSTLNEYQDSGRIDHTDPETLERLYWEEELSIPDIAELADRTENPVRHQMEKHDIPRRDSDTASRMKNDTGHPCIMLRPDGYWYCSSTYKGQVDQFKLSRLLATLLVDDLDELKGKDVHHKNHHKGCDYIGNLEIMEPSEHWSLHTQGSNHQNSKLTESDVKEIKGLLENSDMSQREIGERYGVDQTAISKINVGRAWTHVD